MLSKIYNSTPFTPIIIFLCTSLIYFLTLAPTYLPPDGAEFALCIQTLGICHPTGFFLYIVLGKLLTLLLPFGSLIYKVNLISAIYASGTMLFTYLSLLHMDVNKRISFLTVLVFAFSSSMWEFAVSADVFTLATLLLSITLYTIVTSRFYLSFFFTGLLTSLFPNSIILLPIVLLFWKKSDDTSLISFIQGLFFFFVGVLIFIVLLFLRMQQQPLIDWGHVATLGDFFNYLTRKEFGGIFLIQTHQDTFSLSNLFLQLWTYSEALFIQFGLILPIIGTYGIIRAKLYKNETVVFLLLSFVLLAGMNIFSLSSLNPGVNTNFQFDKFYLSSFTVFILLLGIGLGKIKGATARNYTIPGVLLLIILIQLLANFSSHNYRNDYYSQQVVNDSLSELPDNAIAITLTNQYFFESWYEQDILHKYKNITLLYFPNNVNTDFEKYHPELFSNAESPQLSNLNNPSDLTSQSIVTLIAQNPGRPIFIWQGDYENGEFVTNNAFANMLIPYGLWWKVGNSQVNSYEADKTSEQLLDGSNKTASNTNDLNSVQRLEDLHTYPDAVQSTSYALIKLGKYDEALAFLQEESSLDNNPDIQKEIAAINEITTVEPQITTFTQEKDQNSLLELAMDYYTVKDFNNCIGIFKDILTFDNQDPQMYSNIASMYALENDKNDAINYYDKALQIDPTLSGAISGKNQVESGQ